MIPTCYTLMIAVVLLVTDARRTQPDIVNLVKDSDAGPGQPIVTAHPVQTMMVTLPENAAAGQLIQVQAPNGQMLQITVPQGAVPGQQIQVGVPAVSHATQTEYLDARFIAMKSLTISNDVLVPALVPGPGEVFEFKNKEKTRFMETNEYKWELDKVENSHAHTKQKPDLRIATLKGKWQSNSFGHQSVHVQDHSGQEIFKIRRSKNVWNPMQRRFSFRILPPGSKDNEDALFTINKDQFGRWLLYQEWRVYQGRERDGKPIMYCLGSFMGWDFKMYRSQEDYENGAKPIAKIEQKKNLGAFVEHTWLPDKFTIKVYEGTDAALVLALSTIIDMVNDSQGGKEGIVDPHRH